MAGPVHIEGAWWRETADGRWLCWDDAGRSWKASDPPPPPRRSPRAAPTAVLSHAPTVLAVAGFVVYAIVRIAYDQFYARLATTPEEIGLDQTLILGRAALYLFLFATAVAAIVGVTFLFFLALDPILAGVSKGKRPSPENAVSWTSAAASALAGLASSLGLRSLIPDALLTSDDGLVAEPGWVISQSTAIAASALAVACAIAAFVHWVLGRRGRMEHRRDQGATLLDPRTTITVAFVSVILASFVISGRYGFVKGDEAGRGVLVKPGPLSLLSVQASRVCVDWLSGPPPTALVERGPVPWMYLGQVDAQMVLYAYEETDVGGPVRFPAGSALLERPEEGECEAAILST